MPSSSIAWEFQNPRRILGGHLLTYVYKSGRNIWSFQTRLENKVLGIVLFKRGKGVTLPALSAPQTPFLTAVIAIVVVAIRRRYYVYTRSLRIRHENAKRRARINRLFTGRMYYDVLSRISGGTSEYLTLRVSLRDGFGGEHCGYRLQELEQQVGDACRIVVQFMGRFGSELSSEQHDTVRSRLQTAISICRAAIEEELGANAGISFSVLRERLHIASILADCSQALDGHQGKYLSQRAHPRMHAQPVRQLPLLQ